MLDTIRTFALALLAPLLLAGCFYEPGKFESSLTIGADRSFTFTYSGEVIATEPSQLANAAAESDAGEGEDKTPPPEAKPDPAETAKKDAEYRAVAEALAKEPGFRKAEYVGDGVFLVDYAIRSKLTHSFVFPLNVDAKMILPWVAIELRGTDKVRVTAPGYAEENDDQQSAMTGQAKPPSRMDGVFRLVTDAAIVSQNNEDGATTAPDGRKTIKWRATPLTKDAPMAVLQVAGP